jgi:hypothetical protein
MRQKYIEWYVLDRKAQVAKDDGSGVRAVAKSEPSSLTPSSINNINLHGLDYIDQVQIKLQSVSIVSSIASQSTSSDSVTVASTSLSQNSTRSRVPRFTYLAGGPRLG